MISCAKPVRVAGVRLLIAVGLAGSIASLAAGCATMQEVLKPEPVTRVTVQSFSLAGPRVTEAQAYRDVTRALIDRGFDIKATSEGAGLVTTEYWKYASFGMNPPFDYYMQIRAVIRKEPGGGVSVQLSPTVKEQNRVNAAAFTENELAYFNGEANTVRKLDGMDDGWRSRGLTAFMNVVSDVAGSMSVSVDDAVKNVTETPMMITWDNRLVAR